MIDTKFFSIAFCFSVFSIFCFSATASDKCSPSSANAPGSIAAAGLVVGTVGDKLVDKHHDKIVDKYYNKPDDDDATSQESITTTND